MVYRPGRPRLLPLEDLVYCYCFPFLLNKTHAAYSVPVFRHAADRLLSLPVIPLRRTQLLPVCGSRWITHGVLQGRLEESSGGPLDWRRMPRRSTGRKAVCGKHSVGNDKWTCMMELRDSFKGLGWGRKYPVRVGEPE